MVVRKETKPWPYWVRYFKPNFTTWFLKITIAVRTLKYPQNKVYKPLRAAF